MRINPLLIKLYKGEIIFCIGKSWNLFRPFRAFSFHRSLPQGFALSWCILPFQGKGKDELFRYLTWQKKNKTYSTT